MIRTCNDDVLSAQTPVIPVNLVGVMGKGLALQAKNRWPSLYGIYRDALRTRTLSDITGYDDPRETRPVAGVAAWPSPEGQTVILAPTKRHWRDKSPAQLVAGAINAIPHTLNELGAGTVNLPPIGCGLGGLDHREVLDWVIAAARRHPEVEWVLHRWPASVTEAFGIANR